MTFDKYLDMETRMDNTNENVLDISTTSLLDSVDVDDMNYNHVPLKTAFSVKAIYKFIGKMPPRQLPEIDKVDEE